MGPFARKRDLLSDFHSDWLGLPGFNEENLQSRFKQHESTFLPYLP